MHRVLTLFIIIGAIALSGAARSSAERKVEANSVAEVVAGLKQARKIVHHSNNDLWTGYGTAPMGFLLISKDREILLCDRRVPDGFKVLEHNTKLNCTQSTGPRSWRQPSFLAAMPAFGAPSVIVMGSPQDTGKSLLDWTLTIFHEHFHQWQAQIPGYYDRVEALNLSAGDQTGMWMLNYPFPYEDAGANAAYTKAALALHDAVAADQIVLAKKTAAYLDARKDFAASVPPEAWRYFEFQLWQEGVARWTEIEVGAASDQNSLKSAAVALKNDTLKQLQTDKLSHAGRVAVYAYGAAEAMLLQRINPTWRNCYVEKFELGLHLAKQCMAAISPRILVN